MSGFDFALSDDELPVISFRNESCRKETANTASSIGDSLTVSLRTDQYDASYRESADTNRAFSVSNVVRIDSDLSDDESLGEYASATNVVKCSQSMGKSGVELETCEGLLPSYNAYKLSNRQVHTLSSSEESVLSDPPADNSENFCKGLSSQTSSVSSLRSTDIKPPKRNKKTENPDIVKIRAAKQLEKERRLKEKEEKRLQREEEKHRRDQAKQEAELEKTRKRLVQDAMRSKKPGECMKYMIVRLDTQMMSEPCGAAILTCLQSNNIRYEVEKQPQPNIITFWREQVTVAETELKKLHTTCNECVENEVLLYVPLVQFLQLVRNYHQQRQGTLSRGSGECTLTEFVQERRSSLGNCNMTLLVRGVNDYYRQQKTDERAAFRKRVKELGGAGSGGAKRKKMASEDSVIGTVSKVEVEEALLCVQLEVGCVINFVDNDLELAKMVLQYAKAVGERPFKLEKREASSGFSMFVDGNRGTRVGADGTGLTNVWREQLMQFKNVSADIANAIIAQYPSPRSLYDGYKSCATQNEAELLLADLIVRRGAGVLATVRRVGKEISRRLYIFMTSTDPNVTVI